VLQVQVSVQHLMDWCSDVIELFGRHCMKIIHVKSILDV